MKLRSLLFVFCCLMLLSHIAGCRRSGAPTVFDKPVYEAREAGLFRILGRDGAASTVVETLVPWQGADTTSRLSLLIVRDGEEVPAGFDGQVVHAPVRRVAVMSSSYVAMLDVIGAVDRVVAVSGIDFISNEYVQAGRDTIADIGYDNNIDYEKLIGVNPDLVLLYGVNGSNAIEPKLRELGIPFAYMGEFMEESPLGKAEWIVPLGEMLDLRAEAEQQYNRIDSTYRALSEASVGAETRPAVMVNTPYRDQWMMPSSHSYMVRLISDAGGCYVYSGNDTNSSQPIDMEQAYLLADSANVWINVGQIASADELRRLFPKFADVRPLKDLGVWNTTLLVTPGGGNEFWETSVVNPDLVLRDMIKIFHPELFADSAFRYYKRL